MRRPPLTALVLARWPAVAVSVGAMVVIAASQAAYAALAAPAMALAHTVATGDATELPAAPVTVAAGVAAGLVAISVLKAVGFWLQEVTSSWVAFDVARELKDRVFAHLLAVRPQELLRQPRGALASLVTQEAGQVQQVVHPSLSLAARHLVTLVLVGGYALWLDPVLGAAGLLGLPVAIGLVAWSAHRSRQRHTVRWDADAGVGASVAEMAGMAPMFRAYTAEDGARTAFSELAVRARDRALATVRLDAVVGPGVEVFGAVGVGAALVLGAAVWTPDPAAAEGYATFLVCMFFLYRPARWLGDAVPRFAGGLGALDRLDAVLALEPERPDPPGAVDLDGCRGELLLEGVCFDYGQGPVLAGVDLRIGAGEVVALAGRNGAGKSTLLHVLLRLLEPTAGVVRLDGHDVTTLTRRSVRAQVAWVPQQPLLLASTVLANVALGDPTPDRGRAEAAIREAGAHDVVARLGGVEAVLDEGAGTLSGGERQRLCIARALYRRSPVLLLDEPTAALDGLSEREFAETLDRIRGGHTVVVVTHRRSTALRCDRVVVLDGGRVVEEGRPAEVWAANGVFRELFDAPDVAG